MSSDGISRAELGLATRNAGMPLEALQWPVTPLGLHYLLIHYDIPAVDPNAFRLLIDGTVSTPRSLSLAELKLRPEVRMPITFECAGNGRALMEPRPVSQPWLVEAVGTGEWTGTPLRPLLEEAGLEPRTVEVAFTGLDRGVEGGVEQDYARSLPVADALGDDVLLAWGLNGGPLPPQHGAPLRLVVPGWYGMTNVKWLTRITAMAEPFTGYQNATGYRLYGEDGVPGEPVTRMRPRSLLRPPGIPDFMTRARRLAAGPVLLEGRAWSGTGAVTRVEVSTDGGASWADAKLGEAGGRWAWRGWSFEWAPGPGDYELCSRATDETGATQGGEPDWNAKGYANNAVQRVPVTVVQP